MNWRKGRRAGSALALVVAGCGGGGGGQPPAGAVGSGPGNVIIIQPGGTPTPTPAPTYVTANDLTSDRAYLIGVGFRTVSFQSDTGASSVVGSDLPSGQALLQFYVGAAAPGRFELNYITDREVFASADTDAANSVGGYRFYRKTDNGAIASDFFYNFPPSQTPAYLYMNQLGWRSFGASEVRGAVRGRAVTYRQWFWGEVTNGGDYPYATRLSYQVGIQLLPGSAPQTEGKQATGYLDVDAVALGNNVTGRTQILQLVSSGLPPANLRFTGTIDRSTSAVNGTVADEAGAYSGSFTGRLFGPGGKEFGLAMRITDGSGRVLIGSGLGQRS